jgi:hypothetical protein
MSKETETSKPWTPDLEPDELAKLDEDDIIAIVITKDALADIIRHPAPAPTAGATSAGP